MAGPPIARLTVWPNHRVTLCPAVRGLDDLLVRPVWAFAPGGPLGHRATRAVSIADATPVRVYLPGAGGRRKADGVLVPVGLVPAVAGRLDGLGFALAVDDRRADSPRWVRCPAGYAELGEAERDLLDAVDEHRAVAAVARSDARAAGLVAAAAAAYPAARIAVAVPSRALLGRITRRLAAALPDPVGRFAAPGAEPARVTAGLVGRLPRCGHGESDLLVLPWADAGLSAEAVREATSGRYRRVLALVGTADVRDVGVRHRLRVVTAGVWPPPAERPPVSVVVLPAGGTRPAGRPADPLETK